MSNVILVASNAEIAAILANMIDTIDQCHDLAKERHSVSPDAMPALLERIERLTATVPRPAARPAVTTIIASAPFVPASTIEPVAPTKVPDPIPVTDEVIDPIIAPAPDPNPILCQVCGAPRGLCVHDLSGEGSL